jgi:hypothetical protein
MAEAGSDASTHSSATTMEVAHIRGWQKLSRLVSGDSNQKAKLERVGPRAWAVVLGPFEDRVAGQFGAIV